MDKPIILIIDICFPIGLTNLVLYLFYRREKNIQKKCTSKISGIVVDYDNRNEMVIPLPIVEYMVNEITYRKKFEYAYYVETPNKKKQKQQQDLLNSLKEGTEVITIGGIKGTIAFVGEDYVEIRVDKGVKLTFRKSAIANVINNNQQ